MVSGADRPEGRNERAQLLLVGAITLAFVIVSLAVIFNGVMFANQLPTSGSTSSMADAETFERQTGRDVGRLVLYTNHYQTYDETTFDTALTSAVLNYSQLRMESRLNTRPGYVNVTTISYQRGTRLVQTDDRELTSDGGAANWTPVSSDQVGWLVLNLDAANVSDGGDTPFELSVTDTDDGDWMRLYVSRNTTTGLDSTTLDIETELSTGNGTAVQPCASSGGRLLVDVIDGETFGGGCSFNTTEHLDGPYQVDIGNGDAARGTYSIVTDATPSPDCPDPSGPCESVIAWELTVQTTYETTELTARHKQNVTVYR